MKKLFDTITIEGITIKPNEWFLYEGCVKAAEAFSKTILLKSPVEVVGFINKLSGYDLRLKDFTGDVKISLLGQETSGLKYKVWFGLIPKAKNQRDLGDSVELSILAINKEKPEGSFNTDPKGTLIEDKGNRYFIKIFTLVD